MANDLTSMLMANPWMFDPSQMSNQFSNYNNQAMPFPPSYYGVPHSAATGQPIASYQAPQAPAATPGMTLNSAPGPDAGAAAMLQKVFGMTPQQQTAGGKIDPMTMLQLAMGPGVAASANNPSMMTALGVNPWGSTPGTSQGAPGGQGGQGAPPNNWYAALSALANPGNPMTPGATVPMQQGYQPAGGINQAFLQARGMGPGATGTPAAAPMGMNNAPANMNFLNALQAIQNRPQ